MRRPHLDDIEIVRIDSEHFYIDDNYNRERYLGKIKNNRFRFVREGYVRESFRKLVNEKLKDGGYL